MMDQTPTMTDDDLLKAAHEMEAMGGGFASCIAQAFYRADARNRRRLLYAFGDLFVQFAPTNDEEAEQ